MVRLALSILLTIPTLTQIVWKHSEVNLTEVERMKKVMDDKEMALVERDEEVK